MDPKEYQQQAARTECDQTKSVARMATLLMSSTKEYSGARLSLIRFNHGVLGISKEAGELQSLLEKCVYYGQNLDINKVKDELGDVMWYVALVCNSMGLDLGEVMEANIRKLKTRYPDKFTEEDCTNRDRKSEYGALSRLEDKQLEEAKVVFCSECGPDGKPNPANHPGGKSGHISYRTCYHCNGSGEVTCEWDVANKTTCFVCNGRGTIPV